MRQTLLISVAAFALAAGSTAALSQGSHGGGGGAAGMSGSPSAGASGGGMNARPSGGGAAMQEGSSGAAADNEMKGGAETKGAPAKRTGQMEKSDKSSHSAQRDRNDHEGGFNQKRVPLKERQGANEEGGSKQGVNERHEGSKQGANERHDDNTRQGANERHEGGTRQGANEQHGAMKSSNVSLTTEQKTTIREKVLTKSAPRVEHVNFDIKVGVVVPRTVHFAPVPATLITIEPEWRGYDYFVYADEIIIVNPRTLEIIAVVAV